MSLRRLLALTGKELRELRWLALSFLLLGLLVVTTGTNLRYAFFFTPAAALLDLLVVASLFAALLAERQGADIGGPARRHLLSFPLQPLEVVAAKLLSFLLAQVLLLLLGLAGYCGASWFVTSTSPLPVAILLAAGRILLFSLVCWSLELAIVAWPRLGLAAVLTLLAVYSLALALVPQLRKMFNLFTLPVLWIDGVPQLGPCLAAAILAWFGIFLTGWAVAVRAAES